MNLEINLQDLELDVNEYVGQNWFDTFVEKNDQKLIRALYNSLLEWNAVKETTCTYDIKSLDGKHLLIDFFNEIKYDNNQKYLLVNGIPHY